MKCEWYDCGIRVEEVEVDSLGRCQGEVEEFLEMDEDIGVNVCGRHYSWGMDGLLSGAWARNYWMAVARAERSEKED